MAGPTQTDQGQAVKALSADSSVPELLVHLARTVRAARRLDINEFESADSGVIRKSLLPSVQRLVRFAAEVLEQMLNHYQPDTSVLDGPGAADERAKVSDLCFVGKLELVGALQRIREPLDDVDRSALLSRAILCRGAIVNVATSIDEAVCRAEGWTRTLDNVPELKESMIVRSAYSSLQEKIQQIPAPAGGDVFPALAAARDALTFLLVPPLRELLRLSDRESLEQVGGKLDAWLAGPGPGDERTGRLLWEELNLLTSMLLQVNNRQELIAHDLQVTRRLLERLGSPPADGWLLDGAFLAELRSIRGRERTLDRIIDYLESSVLKELKAVLLSVSDRLAAETGGTASDAQPDAESADPFEAEFAAVPAVAGPAAASATAQPERPLTTGSEREPAQLAAAGGASPASDASASSAQGSENVATCTPAAKKPASTPESGGQESTAKKSSQPPLTPAEAELEELSKPVDYELDFDAAVPQDD